MIRFMFYIIKTPKFANYIIECFSGYISCLKFKSINILEFMRRNNSIRWNQFIKEISNLIFFWFFGILFFFIYRSLFIYIFRKEVADFLSYKEYVVTLFLGFKFDCTAVAYFMLIPFILTLALSYFGKFGLIRKFRIGCQYVFVILSSFICIITINYYKEFNDQFNNFIFLGLYDDKKAVLQTIIDYYNPMLNLTIFVIVSILGILIFRYYEKGTFIYNILQKVNFKGSRVFLIILSLYLFMACLRGTLTYPPVMRKWAAISVDTFLNKVIINPYRSLKYAYGDFKRLNAINGDNPFIENIDEIYDVDYVTDIIGKKSQGASIDKPKQIFLVIMESYDAWPLMDKYSSFGLSSKLGAIAKKGTHFTNFLPSYNATFYAYGTIAGGIPYNGVNISEIGTMSETYLTSIFKQFNDLGYKTNMFYGGFLSWENIGDFTLHMGCDKIYSGVDVGGKSESGAWGIEDEKLFDMVINNVDTTEYSFNLILTSSYHGPYSVDVDSKGFIYNNREMFPPEMKRYDDGRMNLRELGHLWYGDWAIGRFVDTAEAKFTSSLFAFTGDHFGRRFINHNPDLYERSAVPFILYGKGVSAQKLSTPGSHIDIAPTLVELVAPEGFTYYSFGQSMFASDKKLGIAFEKIIDTDSLYMMQQDGGIAEINLVDYKENQSKTLKHQEEYNKLLGLSWHYIIRGNSIKSKDHQFTHRK